MLQSTIFPWNNTATPTAVGEVRRFFSDSTATLSEMRCHATTLNVGERSHAPHQHPEEEMIIVKEGVVAFEREGVETLVGAGGIIFQQPNQMHGMRNGGDVPATYYVLIGVTPQTGAASA